MVRWWEFSDVEFVTLWRDAGERGLPTPFSEMSRIRLWVDYQRAERQAREKLRGELDSTFDGVMAALARPDIRIVVKGGDPAEWRNPESRIRLYAARKGDRGFVVDQLPGETSEHAGGFTVTECEAVGLARELVGALPGEAAGAGDVPLMTHGTGDRELDHEYQKSAVYENTADKEWRRTAEFLGGPISRFAVLTLEQGNSTFGPQGVVQRRLRMLDRVDDGRYVIAGGGDPVAVAVDDARLIAMINKEIAETVRAIKDERGAVRGGR